MISGDRSSVDRQPQSRAIAAGAHVVVVSDTHLTPRRLGLPSELLDAVAEADLVLHAGDFSCVEALERFRDLKPTWGVFGNTDPPEISTTLPPRLEFQIGELRGVMVHGDSPRGVPARSFVAREFAGHWDLVIYGHSHQPRDETVNGTRFLNPGSPTSKRREPRFSFATISVDSTGDIDCRLHFF